MNLEDVSLHSRVIKVFDKSLYGAMSKGCLQYRLYGSRCTKVQREEFDETLKEMVYLGVIRFTNSDINGIAITNKREI